MGALQGYNVIHHFNHKTSNYWNKIYFGLIRKFLYRKYSCIFFPFFFYNYFPCHSEKTKSNYCPFKFEVLWKKWCITFQYPSINKNARVLPHFRAQNFESKFWPSFSAGCREQSWPRFPHCYSQCSSMHSSQSQSQCPLELCLTQRQMNGDQSPALF